MHRYMDVSEERIESLRCLWASRASLEVVGWLRQSEQFKHLATDDGGIHDKLLTIRSFLVPPSGLTQQQIESCILGPVSLQRHIYEALFADVVRWWAAAHRTGQDRNKYLQERMYKDGFVGLWQHFYHWFRNNQLAHYPGGSKSNDVPFLTPPPYGFPLTGKELEQFRSLWTYSMLLTLAGEKCFEALRAEADDTMSFIEEWQEDVWRLSLESEVGTPRTYPWRHEEAET